ncbi:vomeronasal type-1 receptor 90-like [Marmota flaviventris]|uniref:vomeronasal type-1 receptor 90-like n=1 Tax=Marmota flaviventris TaxID=93162 RepID=UPI000FFF87A0|nr:vomeronasal type-1 receptor 90-like [Marmota flaviventris]
MEKHPKLNGVANLRSTFYSEVGIGIVANTLLFLFHVIKFLYDKRLKSTDWIVGLLALTHLLMLLTIGFLAADTLSPQQGLWGDIRCKSVTNWYRLMRGLYISATCLLSVLQAITLSPRSSPLAKFKPKSPQDSMRSLLFLWVFYMSFSTHFSISVVDDSNGTSPNLMFLSDSCTILHRSYFLRHLFTALGAFWDIVLIGLMALSSGYMVIPLCRHKRQCQHLHTTRLSPKASPEQRATRTILLLLGFFILIYLLDCVVSSLRTMWKNDPVCCCIQMIVANGYATISPLVFICTEKQSVTFLKGLWGKNRQCLIIA